MSKYTFLWSNAHQLFYMTGSIDSYRRYPEIPFNRAELVFQASEGNLMSCYVGTADLERHVGEGELFLDTTRSHAYFEDAKKQCANHRAFFKELEVLDLSTASESTLLTFWRGLIDNYAHSLGYFRSSQDEPSRLIVKAVTEKLSPEDALTLLVSPKLDEINREEVAWEELLTKGFSREAALAHIKDFPWLFQNSLTYDETVNELEQRKQGHVTRDIKQEKAELGERQEKILAAHPELAESIEILHELALLRPEVKACWGATGYYANPMLEEIARRFGIDQRTLTFLYRSEDTDELLASGKILSMEEVEDWKLCTAYHLKSGVLHTSVGAEALALKREILEEDKSANVTELKGACARPGKVTGKVHILKVNDPVATREFRDSFTDGVLVTSMTQPNVVDIARRAAAIVTDEGGMLCHAAIISREFGIPCVVGTHKATQVLKDGDLVEVDADAGIVRIL